MHGSIKSGMAWLVSAPTLHIGVPFFPQKKDRPLAFSHSLTGPVILVHHSDVLDGVIIITQMSL